MSSSMPSSTATTRLTGLYQRDSVSDIPVDEIQQAVAEGADVMLSHQAIFGLKQPILHSLISRGAVEAVKACLQSPLPICFTTVTNYRKENMLHLVCRLHPPATMRAMLEAMIHRLETHPRDTVGWGCHNVFKQDVLDVAAYSGTLSILWPLVQDIPFFAGRTTPFVLTVSVYNWDWESIAEEDREMLLLNQPILTPSEALHRLAHQKEPDPYLVEQCVLAGADVMYTNELTLYAPTFHTFVMNGCAKGVEACLRTLLPIDFATTNDQPQPLREEAGDYSRPLEGNNPLHLLCMLQNRQVAATILECIVRRLENPPWAPLASSSLSADGSWESGELEHVHDTICWEQKNRAGLDFVECAAKGNKLSVFWPVIRHITPFRDMIRPDLV